MANMESRTNSALFKRAEQLRRWEESETNKEPSNLSSKTKKIQFSDGCVFLSACAAGDKEEVLKLLRQGADIDTPNVDGLTALHQACIDDNLDMVEFLVEQGADINRGDHEGWTPLHATASCGFLSIARYLIEHNADVAAVNNDGELPIDIAETEAMEELLDRITQERGIDCDAARSQEERQMLADTARWLEGETKNCSLLVPHHRTGATALHVAAAKGYIRVMSMLIQGGADVNAQDFDGWTPLHAAAHWGQREACQILCEHMADMEIRNYVGQTCFDVADPDVLRLLEECKKRQAVILRERPDVWEHQVSMRASTGPKRRSSVTRLSQTERAALVTSSKKVDKIAPGVKVTEEEKENSTESGTDSPEDDNLYRSRPQSARSDGSKDSPNKNFQPPTSPPSRPPPSVDLDLTPASHAHVNSTSVNSGGESEDVPQWRLGSSRSRQTGSSNGNSFLGNHNSTVIREREELSRSISQPLPASTATSISSSVTSSGTSSTSSSNSALSPESEVTLRRAHSFETDERRTDDQVPVDQTTTATLVLSQPNVQTAANQTTTVRRSFVPPVRDEESETQRKAHAKRVRETRRSTQGVTLEEVKSAEQLAKKKQAETTSSTSSSISNEQESSQQQDGKSELERRPSWRLCINDSNRNKFSLEDSRTKNNGGSVNVVTLVAQPVSSSASTVTADTTVTLPLRRNKSQDEESKESNSSSTSATAAAATPATIQRRRRPKRRSTGVVQIDMEDIDLNSKDSSTQPGDSEPQSDDSESLSDRGSSSRQASRPSSLGSSVSDVRDENNPTSSTAPSTPLSSHPVAATAAALASGAINANGDIDYKKLWEESQIENERLRDRLRNTHEELNKYKDQLEKALQVSNARNAMTEAEKRERRTLERKLSEMEEELKESNRMAENLRSDIAKMRDENGALIRVISKLSK